MQTHRGLVEYQSARSVFSRTAQGEVNVYTTQICLPNSQVRRVLAMRVGVEACIYTSHILLRGAKDVWK